MDGFLRFKSAYELFQSKREAVTRTLGNHTDIEVQVLFLGVAHPVSLLLIFFLLFDLNLALSQECGL